MAVNLIGRVLITKGNQTPQPSQK